MTEPAQRFKLNQNVEENNWTKVIVDTVVSIWDRAFSYESRGVKVASGNLGQPRYTGAQRRVAIILSAQTVFTFYIEGISSQPQVLINAESLTRPAVVKRFLHLFLPL